MTRPTATGLTRALVARIALVTLVAVPARADDKCAVSGDRVRVMLLDLKASASWQPSAKGLGQIVAEEAGKVRGFSILSAEEVRAALDQQANKALMGCDQNSCLAELAQALDASLVVGGALDETPRTNEAPGALLVSLTLLNTRAIVVVNRVTMSWSGDPKALPDVVRAAARTLLLEPAQRPPGAVKLTGVPTDARVLVDGLERTSFEITGLAIGPHEIKVDMRDKLPLTAYVVVKSGETAEVPVALEDVPVTAGWLWLGGGVAVALGGAAAIGVAYALGQSDVVVQAQIPAYGANDVERVKR